MWTDSAVTLGSIRSDPNRWKTFICNLVTEIIIYTLPTQWFHCPGPDNPADYLSRGRRAQDLIASEIWGTVHHGYETPQSFGPQRPAPIIYHSQRLGNLSRHCWSTCRSPSSFSRFSSYTKVLRTMVWSFVSRRIFDPNRNNMGN